MKTQFFSGSIDSVLFSVFPAKAGKSGISDASAYCPPVFKSRLQPAGKERVFARKPAHQNNSGLPDSLEDWLACKAAREICRGGCDGTEDQDRLWQMAAKPAARKKIPPTASARP
jgi:hypothetical protein